jgi:hypothetical protein
MSPPSARRAGPSALCGLLAFPARALRLCLKRNLLSRINVIWVVQSRLKKYSCFRSAQITFISPAVPSHRGALAIVTDAGRDAVDASGASDESAQLADGEVVWS